MLLLRAFFIVAVTTLAACAGRAPQPVAVAADARASVDAVRSCEASLYRATVSDARALACADVLDVWQ
jgi:hypothetical protein